MIVVSCITKSKKETIINGHYNLIRVIITLESLKNKYFVTADVCGIVKVWASFFKPIQMLEIQQDGAISYNSIVELTDMLPKNSSFEDTSSLIAIALKSSKINIILLSPAISEY